MASTPAIEVSRVTKVYRRYAQKRQFATYMKAHHCAIDGVGSITNPVVGG